MTAGPVLDARGIQRSFAGVRALRGVSFDVRAGEVHALVGENGAGKSTLIKIFTGAETPDAGELRVAGVPIARMDPHLSRQLGIAAIYQQPALFPDLTVGENLALPSEPRVPWRRIDRAARRQRALALLERVGAALDPDRLVRTLSMPEQQLVEIAKALGAEARVLIMDEPTASLTDRDAARLLDVVRVLRTQGVGVIYISHRLEEVEAIADRITVLRDGETVATMPGAAANRAEIIRLMVGRELAAVFPKRDVPLGDVVLEVRGLTQRAAGIAGVSFAVRRGEILGLAGLVGSGRTELAETIFGLRPADEGTIAVNGRVASIRSPADAMAAGIGYVPEDRRRHGVVPELSVAANATLASLGRVARHGLLDRGAERAAAGRFVERLRIKTPSVDQETIRLSGGNQQKVALARWLAIDPAVLILDEPTQGVDVGSKSEIHALMGEMAARGLAVLMISSELPEILGMSDRVAVMRGGRLQGILPRGQADQAAVLGLALGHPA